MIDRDELRRLCADPTLSLAEIGERCGVSRQRVHQVLNQMGISKEWPKRPHPALICPDCGGPKSSSDCAYCQRCSSLRGHGGHDVIDSRGYMRLPKYLRLQHGVLFRHTLVAMQKIGRRLRDDEEVHHIDGNPGNNHPDNLMVVTRQQHIDIDHRCRPNKTGYRGVYPTKSGRYRAAINTRCYIESLGTFDTPEQAAVAYNNAAIRYFGEFARLNLIP